MVENVSWKKGVAEFVGTLALIFVGVLVLTANGGSNALIVVALAHGLTIAVMVSATMVISGGQLNPAVTIGLIFGKKISPAQGGVNILSQMLGGLLGGYLALYVMGGADIAGGVPNLAAGVTSGRGIVLEAILTFFLMFVIYGTAVDDRFGGRIGGLAIGLTVGLDIMAGGPLTGAAMNPARWFGAAIPAMQTAADTAYLANGLVYFIGPIIGAVLAAAVWEGILLERKPALA